MYGVKLYLTFDELNEHMRDKVDSQYRNTKFIPIKVEINETDLSVEITMISTDDPTPPLTQLKHLKF